MLSLIKGKQRAGKSYYVVTLIIDYLKSSNRPIYSNLPLNPDRIADIACGGKLRSPAKYQTFLSRIYLYKSARGMRKRKDFFKFYKKNPDYVSLNRKLHAVNKDLIIDEQKIKTFWRITKTNSISFLDEVYEWFSANDYKECPENRKELLSYTRQRGHYKDDLFLISHSESDVDTHIRKGIQALYVIENLKYTNISDKPFLMGIKWPIQAFRIKVYQFGDKKHSDYFIKFQDKRIFTCYDSFSTSGMLNKDRADDDALSTDTHIDVKKNLFGYLKQIYPLLIIGVSCLASIIYGYNFFINHFLRSSNTIASNSASVNVDKADVTLQSFYKVIFMSPKTIIFDDGYKLNKGDIIYGLKVIAFKSGYAVLSDGGKLYNVSYTGLRIREEQQERHNDNRDSSRKSSSTARKAS